MKTTEWCLAPLIVVVLTLACNAADELGPLDEARKNHPAVFVPCNVMPYTVAGKDGYTYAGEAEQCFSGDMAESDAELYQEAKLAAKGNLLNFLKKKNPNSTVSIVGAVVMYQFPEDKSRRVVCFVDKSSISIRREIASQIPKTTNFLNIAASSKSPGENAMCGRGNGSVEQQSAPVCTTFNNECKTIRKKLDRTCVASNRDKVISLQDKIALSPSDCLLRCRLARIFVKDGKNALAAEQYDTVFKIIISDERYDRTIAAESLMEGAQFFESEGANDRALKFYRILIRCNDMRHWGMNREVGIANAKITELLLK